MWLYPVVGLVALQRLLELVVARHNTARLLAAGGHEVGARHYPLFIVLHTAWLATLLLAVDPDTVPDKAWLGLFLLLQAARVWIVISLGERWTTRIIVMPGSPLVRRGPYRLLRHPNYAIVAGEIAALPLAFHAWVVAAIFTITNGALLIHRIRVEDSALRGG